MDRTFLLIGLSIILVKSSHAYTCDRTPKRAEKNLPNIDKYIIEIVGNPEKYSPGENYTLVLKSMPSNPIKSYFTEFMLVVEPANTSEVFQYVLSGDLYPKDDSIARFTPKCPNAVIQTNSLAKSEVEIYWKAPPADNGCVAFKATVFESTDSWYTDDGGLTRVICAEEENEDVQPDVLQECSACYEAKYEIAFQGMWTRNTHPKDYPPNMWTTKLGEIIGASHKHEKSFWSYEEDASDGLKLLAEEGNSTYLEDELKEMVKNDNIRTIIKARELSYPNIIGTSYTVFRVDQKHHLISLVSKITPSPDWIVGVANLELCTPNGEWLKSKTLNLYPWDVGTDDGPTYSSPDLPSFPRKPIKRITSSDENTPFFNTTLKPIAKLKVTRQKLYEKSCEPEEKEDNCQMTDWSHWSNCSTTCRHRVRTRDRQLVHLENLEECSSDGPLILEQTEDCGDQEEDAECEDTECVNAVWSNWTPCSVTCGDGIKTRTGTLPKNGGEEEQHDEEEENNPNEEEPPCLEAVECYNIPCTDEETVDSEKQLNHVPSENQIKVLTEGPSYSPVVNCTLSRWSDWGKCTATEPCTTGYQYKERHIEIHPSNGGRACPKTLQRHRKCHAPCGNGEEGPGNRKNRRKHKGGGTGAVDCEMGPWSAWSPCSSNCGASAVQQRTRSILVYPSKGGQECGPRLEERNCPLPYACNDRESFLLHKMK